MIWIWPFLIGASAGMALGWITCACLSMGHEDDQQELIWRLRQAVFQFSELVEPYCHNNPRLAALVRYAAVLLNDLPDL